MTRYALLVRGINVGGKNKVVMAQLRQELAELGLENVETYINSGNIFFESAGSKAELVDLLGHIHLSKVFPWYLKKTMKRSLERSLLGGSKKWLERMFSFIPRA